MMQLVKKKGTFLRWILALCLVVTGSVACEDEYRDPFNAELQKTYDEELIKEYLTANNITQYTRTPSGLYYVVIEPGNGARPVTGDRVEVGYVGKYVANGVIFQSTYAEAKTFMFNLGKREVIAGWDEGIALMQKNEKARLIIPSHLAYGRFGNSSVPPNTAILFDIHLINF